MDKSFLKQILGELPWSAEIYSLLRRMDQPPTGGFDLERLRQALPDWQRLAAEHQRSAPAGKRILIFSMLRYWIEQTTLVGLALAAQGHQVALAYLPHTHWKAPLPRFDLRRQDLYLQSVLKLAQPQLEIISLYDAPRHAKLPAGWQARLEESAYRDWQYTLLREDVDPESELYQYRLQRNRDQARAMYQLLQSWQPDVLVLPNGSILEFGISFQVAQEFEIPAVTYEFGEQSERMWLGQDADVMRQDTSDIWAARGRQALDEQQWGLVKEFFAMRQGGGLWQNFTRRWQGIETQGGERIRQELGLDKRPLALLATNVFGDSLTLGRNIFSESITEWLVRTIDYFSNRPQAQLVVRIHPGEMMGWGTSSTDTLRQRFPELPENVHIIPADAKINSYDLVEIADVGLVFTTTIGMEMAMSGLPVVVTGWTHYRGKGFTLDPDSWQAYFSTLDRVLAQPEEARLSRAQSDLAWNYAYRFFFEYPLPFPWHVQHFWRDVERWPLEKVLSDEGQAIFAPTFRYLSGEKIEW